VAVILAHLGLPARGGSTAQTALVFLGVTALVWLRGDASQPVMQVDGPQQCLAGQLAAV